MQFEIGEVYKLSHVFLILQSVGLLCSAVLRLSYLPCPALLLLLPQLLLLLQRELRQLHGGLGAGLGSLHELGHNVDGDGEDDGGVVLGGDAVQGLQISQLEHKHYRSCNLLQIYTKASPIIAPLTVPLVQIWEGKAFYNNNIKHQSI